MIRILKQVFRTGIVTEPVPPITDPEIEKIAVRLEEVVKRRFRGSLAIRQVDAGSCNGCELEIHAINNSHLQLRAFRHSFYRLAAFCGHAPGHRAGLAQYGDRAQENL